MTKTIADLWNGSLEPIRHSGKNNSEMRQIENLMIRNLEKLEDNLDEKSKEAFKKYTDCADEYLIITSEQAFCDGFCLATKIVTEALSNAEEII